ncbi:hypothetical protein BpHYR1_051255 [Brachionus plicatilis]|uniref:Uncharacterized protein n=1 Tax=Brachionus plicatilis TaxID=10195 RepID=A0A3M7T9C6_BRAPC|nr:hypothetical protein BpHYR1_051255 [Brachionus plicatilis]
MRSKPSKLSVIDTLTIAPSVQLSTASIRPYTSSEKLSDSLEQPPPSQEISQPKKLKNKDVIAKRSARLGLDKI